MYSTIRLEHEGRIATVTLARAEKRNAISRALIAEFLAALAEAEQAGARVLVVAAEGKAFCAGLDLEELKSMATQTPEENRGHSEQIASLFTALYEFPLPTIAAVQGAAIAGGAGLATLCDFTLAAPEASFGYTEVRIGLVPALVSAFLVRQVGAKHAHELLLTGRRIGAAEAHRIGLVNELVSNDGASGGLAARTRQLAEELAANSPAAMRATKALLRSYDEASLRLDLERGLEANAAMRRMPDFAEGIASFLQRRKPGWSE